ncbi:MAG: glycosyltransferase family 4 protein [Candidatus Liptonbacteria bacterium]|nr:glycosyltransferase family 4 protein [Candidatus Liptonbacteria bacterium]
MPEKKLTVAYFGNYDPLYTRVRTVIKGLRKNNVKVIECRSNHRNRLRRLAILAVNYFKIQGKIDAILVSEGGQSYVPLAKILSFLTRKPLIFDAFISYYHVKAIDTSDVRPDSIKGRFFYYRDKISCLLADKVLLDTKEHAEYFCKEFGLPRSKFEIVPVGSDEDFFYPEKSWARKKGGDFVVFLVSSYYPLHGVDYVVRAAKILEKYSDIKFLIIGDGITKQKVLSLANDLNVKNIIFRGSVYPDVLPDFMASADVCLGQFGGTEQGHMVVPAKVYDALAMAKPVITGNGMAAKTMFKHQEHLLFCPFADAETIANTIVALKTDKELRDQLAANGHKFFKENFNLQKVGSMVRAIIEKQIDRSKATYSHNNS